MAGPLGRKALLEYTGAMLCRILQILMFLGSSEFALGPALRMLGWRGFVRGWKVGSWAQKAEEAVSGAKSAVIAT